jgi:restriction system protein
MWVFQCKHNHDGVDNLGPNAIRALNGTAWDFHNADRAIVVTNKGFTRAARADAGELGIDLIDRGRLIRWATEGESLHQVLGLTPGHVRGRRRNGTRP